MEVPTGWEPSRLEIQHPDLSGGALIQSPPEEGTPRDIIMVMLSLADYNVTLEQS